MHYVSAERGKLKRDCVMLLIRTLRCNYIFCSFHSKRVSDYRNYQICATLTSSPILGYTALTVCAEGWWYVSIYLQAESDCFGIQIIWCVELLAAFLRLSTAWRCFIFAAWTAEVNYVLEEPEFQGVSLGLFSHYTRKQTAVLAKSHTVTGASGNLDGRRLNLSASLNTKGS